MPNKFFISKFQVIYKIYLFFSSFFKVGTRKLTFFSTKKLFLLYPTVLISHQFIIIIALSKSVASEIKDAFWFLQKATSMTLTRNRSEVGSDIIELKHKQ